MFTILRYQTLRWAPIHGSHHRRPLVTHHFRSVISFRRLWPRRIWPRMNFFKRSESARPRRRPILRATTPRMEQTSMIMHHDSSHSLTHWAAILFNLIGSQLGECHLALSSSILSTSPTILVAKMHPKHYRIRLLFDICHGFASPIACVSFAAFLKNIRLGYATIPCHILAVVLWVGARILYADFIQWREMKRLCARPIPRVAGKWPGNVDILFSMMRSYKTSYLVDTYLELFEKYQSTTLNLRILWADQVCDDLKVLCLACM